MDAIAVASIVLAVVSIGVSLWALLARNTTKTEHKVQKGDVVVAQSTQSGEVAIQGRLAQLALLTAGEVAVEEELSVVRQASVKDVALGENLVLSTVPPSLDPVVFTVDFPFTLIGQNVVTPLDVPISGYYPWLSVSTTTLMKQCTRAAISIKGKVQGGVSAVAFVVFDGVEHQIGELTRVVDESGLFVFHSAVACEQQHFGFQLLLSGGSTPAVTVTGLYVAIW